MVTLRILKRISAETWSECIKLLLFSIKIKMISKKHYNSSKSALMLLKEQPTELWKPSAIKRLVRSMKSWETSRKLLDSCTSSLSFVRKRETNKRQEKHTSSWPRHTLRMEMSRLLSSILKISWISRMNSRISPPRLMLSWSLVCCITRKVLYESPWIAYRSTLN